MIIIGIAGPAQSGKSTLAGEFGWLSSAARNIASSPLPGR